MIQESIEWYFFDIREKSFKICQSLLFEVSEKKGLKLNYVSHSTTKCVAVYFATIGTLLL